VRARAYVCVYVNRKNRVLRWMYKKKKRRVEMTLTSRGVGGWGGPPPPGLDRELRDPSPRNDQTLCKDAGAVFRERFVCVWCREQMARSRTRASPMLWRPMDGES
jgi:hypothetical protein